MPTRAHAHTYKHTHTQIHTRTNTHAVRRGRLRARDAWNKRLSHKRGRRASSALETHFCLLLFAACAFRTLHPGSFLDNDPVRTKTRGVVGGASPLLSPAQSHKRRNTGGESETQRKKERRKTRGKLNLCCLRGVGLGRRSGKRGGGDIGVEGHGKASVGGGAGEGGREKEKGIGGGGGGWRMERKASQSTQKDAPGRSPARTCIDGAWQQRGGLYSVRRVEARAPRERPPQALSRPMAFVGEAGRPMPRRAYSGGCAGACHG